MKQSTDTVGIAVEQERHRHLRLFAPTARLCYSRRLVAICQDAGAVSARTAPSRRRAVDVHSWRRRRRRAWQWPCPRGPDGARSSAPSAA